MAANVPLRPELPLLPMPSFTPPDTSDPLPCSELPPSCCGGGGAVSGDVGVPGDGRGADAISGAAADVDLQEEIIATICILVVRDAYNICSVGTTYL
jgi:hypothetical protein